MKSKILTAVSVVMLFVPWTILPLRGFDWALQSPVAEIMIYSYAAFMVFSGIFSILVYTRGKVKSKLMQVCVAVNSIYAIGAIAIICTTIPGWINGYRRRHMKNRKISGAVLLAFCLALAGEDFSGSLQVDVE